MEIKYLHTMVRVKDLEKSIAFYNLLGLKEIKRNESEMGRFTLVFLAPDGQHECPLELTFNWDGDDKLPSDSRHFGHLAYEVKNIYQTCLHLQENGIVINRPHVMDEWHSYGRQIISQLNYSNVVKLWNLVNHGLLCQILATGRINYIC